MTTPGGPQRPVVCLDIDGVLNALGPSPGYTRVELTMRAQELPKSPFLRGGGREDLEGSVAVNPVNGVWIERLRVAADLFWATTWEHAANRYYAPLLAIAPLAVVEFSAFEPELRWLLERDTASWKQNALRQLFADRSLIWIDDQLGALRPPEGLDWCYLPIDAARGLDDAARTTVEEFVAARALRG